jgi:hypothetical protein
MNTQAFTRQTAILLIVEALLLFAPIIILGAAIEWPAVLDETPDVVLSRIYDNAEAVNIGYLSYLAYSILFFPVLLWVVRSLAQDETFSPMMRLAVGFALVSTLARSLGIIRWLVAMPALAESYMNPATSPQTKVTIEVVYNALNDYGGSVGELLGVSLFAALAVAIVCLIALRSGQWPAWMSYFGLLAAAGLLLNLLETFGVELGALITVTTSLIQLWFLALGIYLLRPAAHHRLIQAPAR